ncbi:hypothetical protein BH23GEM8_BH23GEM8_22000 [soil metagenome]
MDDRPRSGKEAFSDEEASRIWRRAAELQAARRLARPAPVEDHDSAVDDAHALSRPEILAIAAEAGIDAEFVQEALTEAELTPGGAEDDAPPLQARRQISSEPDVVQAALREVAVRPPYSLRLVDVQVTGGTSILIFDLGTLDWGATEWTSFRAGEMAAGQNALAIHALVRAGPAPGSTDLILQGAPNPRLPLSVQRHQMGFGAAGAVAGGAAGFFTAAGLAISGAILAAPALLGAGALGAAAYGSIRAAQKWARRKDGEALERLADEVVGYTRVQAHLGSPANGRIGPGEREMEA